LLDALSNMNYSQDTCSS